MTTTRLVCESCESGYMPDLAHCPYCGCHNQMSYPITLKPLIVDTECYAAYHLTMALDPATGEVHTFQQFDGYPYDLLGLRALLTTHIIVTFNGNNYDIPMLTLALTGASCQALKDASDAIIQNNLRSWQFYQTFGLEEPTTVDTIDLFEVAPGQASLKGYGGKLHTRTIQDLPYAPSEHIDWPKRVMLREYCRNDLQVTLELFQIFPAQIALREQMSEEYGVDLRSKSDAQIAEAAMKAMLGYTPERPKVSAGTVFYYQPPEWLSFQNLPLLDMLARNPFTVTDTGGVAMSEELEKTIVTIGSTSYAMGSGGLHSTESSVIWRADDERSLRSPDVASYYPSLVTRLGIVPPAIGQRFAEIYSAWYSARLAAKANGDKKRANSLKTLLNGTFGKLGSKWSIFYAPSQMIQVTVTGQLALLMLIEALEAAGISVVSANTDGLVLYGRRDRDWLADSVIRWWEHTTGFVMEMTDFDLIAAQGVNSYVGVTCTGDVKLKGFFAPPEPGASGWPNPTGQVCVDAVVAYLTNSTPLADTIHTCTDIRQFVYVRKVKGGGSYNACGSLPKTTTLTHMREVLGITTTGMNQQVREAYAAYREAHIGKSEYLGKTVRWYYADGSRGCILNPQGGLVPRTEGCRPLMTLPDAIPDDLDYAWYINEARNLLLDVGVKSV